MIYKWELNEAGTFSNLLDGRPPENRKSSGELEDKPFPHMHINLLLCLFVHL